MILAPMVRMVPLLILLLLNEVGYAQISVKLQSLKQRYAGSWTDKKTSRCLEIYFENNQYATIMDWTSKYQNRESADVYKAIVKDGKLVMPEEKEHHAPYAEIIAENKKLIYRTKPLTISSTSNWITQVFTRK